GHRSGAPEDGQPAVPDRPLHGDAGPTRDLHPRASGRHARGARLDVDRRVKRTGTTTGDILCLNGGSSSLKFALYRMSGDAEVRLANGAVERLGLPDGRFWLRGPERDILTDASLESRDHRDAVRQVFDALDKHGVSTPAAAGHPLGPGGPAPPA